jgi:hypothetical protein
MRRPLDPVPEPCFAMISRTFLFLAPLALLANHAGCTREEQQPAPAVAPAPAAPAPQPAPAATAAEVVVTFFTEAVPCKVTAKVEGLCRQAVEAAFATELKSGALVYRVLSTESPENEHYLDEYDIGSKALVVARQENGKDAEFVPCHDIWIMIEEPKELADYVQKPIRDYLAKR